MDAFVGEIRLMSFPFAPKGWAYCQGQTLPINQNQALFSLLGTTYGGDGVTTFRLPDLRGRLITGVGAMPGGSTYSWGQIGGSETVTLTQAQMPAHGHGYQGTIQTGTAAEYAEASQAFPAQGTATQFATGTPNASFGANALPNTTSSVGGNQPHDNRQPLIAMNYAIALQGYFPSRG
ncbi:phage tail protein [Hymenobacter ruricola]|uniref:Phage tail protein n=1 Tax=Hymenobacter ruricola TaxID=2791023 RepID=A0ABS0I2K7_9BACT|nr:tail fiber protein [Hymenobacter ruricola]MBF9221175.1 phage tail protein [Hymenobacter ruricola]